MNPRPNSAGDTAIDEMFSRATLHVNAGDFEKAEVLYRDILSRYPGNPRALHALGVVMYRGGGDAEDAIRLVRLAIDRKPDYLDARCNLGNMLNELWRFSEAEECYRAVLDMDPGMSLAWQGLGNIFSKKQCHEEALHFYGKAAECSPDAMVFVLSGTTLRMLGRLEEAAAAFRRALEIKRDCGEAYYGLATVYEVGANLVAAQEYAQQAQRLLPSSSAAMQVMGGILLSSGRADEALVWYRRAVEAGGGALALSNLLYAMNYSRNCPANEICEQSRRWEDVAEIRQEPLSDESPRLPGRLRIGYVSPDFKRHSVAFFFEPILRAHNRQKFEIHCYSNVLAPDTVTERLKGQAEYWHDIRRLSDDEALERIREDRIDILVDLAGHTADNRLGVFARRAAPVQMTWLGYPNTTGVSAIDYRISDAVADPEGVSDSHHSERLIRLPDGFLCYRPPENSPTAAPPPALANGFVTFGSFNNPAKITPEVVELWSRILLAVPDSRLLLKSKPFCDPELAGSFSASFVSRGLSAERIICVPATETISSHLATYGKIDIALDPFPYNGTTTTFEALHMGVPVIALRGNRHAARVGASILTNLGLTELIAESADEYHALAVSLSRDVSRLVAYHAGLRNMLASSLLVDAPRFADSLEDTFLKVWRARSQRHPFSPATLEGLFLQARNLFMQGDYGRAMSLYEEILLEHSDNPRALHGRGVISHHTGDSESSIKYISRALRLHADYPLALVSLASVCKETGRVREALDYSRRALDLDPGFSEIHSNILMNMQYLPEYGRDQILGEARRWSACHARRPFPAHGHERKTLPDSGKIRIGFVSADFKKHPVGFIIIPFLTGYDRERFEVVCYSNSSESDEVTQQIISLVDVWRVIDGESDRAAWQIIRDDSIDILVDLSGHTAGNRLVLFSMRPAPTQASWLGYFDTTGLDSIDYLITDRFVAPSDEGRWFTEKLIHLPDSRFCYAPPEYAPLPGNPSLLKTGYITFGSFNNIAKLTEDVIALWAGIMRQVGGSRLIIKWKSCSDIALVRRYQEFFRKHGIEPEGRIEFRGESGHQELLGQYGEVDIALDPFPFSGGLTSLEALWMGVPIITLNGERPVSRQTASFLKILGHDDLVADTFEQYCACAMALAADGERLTLLHRTLREEMRVSPLCNAAAFTRNLSHAFERIAAHRACLPETNVDRLRELDEDLTKRCNQAARMVESGKLDEAEACYEAVLADNGGHARALHGLGVVKYRKGIWDEGIGLVRNALSRQPDFVDALMNLGKMLHEQGRFEEAADCYHKVADIRPDDRNAMFLMALLLSKAGRRDEAVCAYRQLIAASPDHVDAIFNLGQALIEARCFEEAGELLRRARRLAPDKAGILIALGNLALSQRNVTDAETYYSSACAVTPESAEARTNLGHLFTELKRTVEAIAHCKRAVELKPDFALGWVNLGCALEKSGELPAAVDAYRKALELEPGFHAAHSSLIMLMNYMPDTTPEEIFLESRRWDDSHGACFRNLWNSSTRLGTQGRPLRIGFVSPDFHRHPVGYFVQSFFLLHDHEQFEVVCYSDVTVEDDLTELLREAADCWRNVRTLDDSELDQAIRDDCIDVLVDLAGHTAGNRMRVFAMKPAPVQATWAGYVGTTGLSAMDFLISDRYQSPPGAERYGSERIIRMPHDYISYCAPEYAPDVSVLPALLNGYVTFCVFNNLAKVSVDAITLWADVLKRVDGSRLFFKNPSFDDQGTVERYLRQFESHGISRSRIMTEGQSPPAEMLDRYARVDIQLDTLPYSGGLTTLESLWMGVPVVTLPGELFSSRHSLSHLMNIGLSECVASSPEEYVAIACSLAEDLEGLLDLRARLRHMMAHSPLCDGLGFTRDLQQAFREMWRGKCESVAHVACELKRSLPSTKVLKGRFSYDHIEWNERGNNYCDKGDFDSAISYYKKALEIMPGYLEAHHNLGLAYYRRGQTDLAIQQFQRAITLSPVFAEAYVSLSNLYLTSGRMGDVVNLCAGALAFLPDCPEIHANLGSAFMKQGNADEALRAFRKALELRPGYHQVHSNVLYLLHSMPETTPQEVLVESREWNKLHGSLPSLALPSSKRTDTFPLRIGLVSPDFRLHPVGFFTQAFIKFHDRSRFEVFCYSDVSSEDQMTELFRGCAEEFRDILGLDDDTVSRMIIRDGMDILVDLAGHTDGNRLRLFAMKPAPVQMTWAGYVGTTGLSTIDYLISDRYQSPEGSDAFATEKIIRMPNGYVSYLPPMDSPDVGALPALKNGYVTFSCFNRPSKISDEAVSLWAEVLKRVKGSRLLLKSASFSDATTVESFLRKFADRKIFSDRLLFEGPASHKEMLASYGKVDIQLDSFPYSGGLTTLESLWMGVPVITLPGQLFSSRHSLTHLMNIGIEGCVASTPEEYIAIACGLAGALDRLSDMRASLRGRMAASPVCDGRLFTDHLQNVFYWIWRRWREPSDVFPLVFGNEPRESTTPEKGTPDTALAGDDFSRALSLLEQRDFLEAAELFEQIVSSDPNNADAHNNLGIAYYEIGFRDDAKDEFKLATEISPWHAEAWKNLGKSIRDTGGNPEQAARCFRKALLLDSNVDDSWMMLGTTLLDRGLCVEAVKCFKKSLELNPGNSDAHSNLLFAMNYIPQISQHDLFRESRAWDERHAAGIRPMRRDVGTGAQENKRLRIGYVSGDFKRHPVGYHLLPVLARYDRERFEVFCYATMGAQDDLTEKMRGYVSGWRDITRLSDDAAAELVCDDRIDVLVDLAGHTKGHRLLLFARRPAPIQVSWLGYFNTTGLNTIDYLISDETTIPPGEEYLFSERVIRLPDSRFCYAPPDYAPQVSPPPVLNNGFITFGSFNNVAKLTSEVIELWSKVMHAVPGSRMILKWSTLGRKKERDRLLRRFERHGIHPDRLVARGSSPHGEMLGEYGDVDIALDPFPFSGGMTSCEALWMGVPVITLLGSKPAGRQTAGFLRTIGLNEWIAESREQYVSRVLAAASDWKKLESLRLTLRELMTASTLCDGVAFTRNLESLFCRIVEERSSLQTTITNLHRIDPPPGAGNTSFTDHVAAAVSYNEGVDQMEAGRLEEAIELFERAVSLNPDFPAAYNNLGILMSRTGADDGAVRAFTSAISADPSFCEAHFNLGLVYAKSRRFNLAIECFNAAISLNSGYGEAYLEKGNVLQSVGEPYQALECYEHATSLLPGTATASNNIGTVFMLLEDYHQAERYFCEALSNDPGYAPAYANLSTLYCETGRFSKAEGVAATGLERFTDDPRLLSVYAKAMTGQCRIPEALLLLRRAVELDPLNAMLRSNLLYTLQYSSDCSPKKLFAEHATWSEHHVSSNAPLRQFPKTPDPERKLIIGYVSPDFGRHPVGYFLMPVLPSHDREQFQVICYSDRKKIDDQTVALELNADLWHDTSSCSDQELSELIANDGVDILVDLAGHTAGNRLTLFAKRVAPIQVTWAGYVGTTGLSTMDYLISDSSESPEYADDVTVERILRLPNGYVCYEPPDYAPEVEALPAFSNGYVTFGCFNNLAKINPNVIKLWSELMGRVPGSRILLKTKALNDQEIRQRYQGMFAVHGIESERVMLEGDSRHVDLLATYNRVDIALDPFPYSGGLTTLESLWMGVPVVTLGGERFCSRHSLSHLTNLGMRETIASDAEGYVAVALSLVNNLANLALLRSTLRDRMRRSPLCDGVIFTRNLEAGYRTMWRTWISEQSDSLLRQARELFAVHRYEESESLCERAVESQPFNPGAYSLMGDADRCLLRFEEAEACYRLAYQFQPTAPCHLFDIGLMRRDRGFLSQAIETFTDILETHPDHAKSLSALGRCLMYMGRYREAAEYCKRALQVCPDSAEFIVNLGAVLFYAGEAEEAALLFNRAMAIDPTYPRALSSLLFIMNYKPGVSLTELFEKSKQWDLLYGGEERRQIRKQGEKNRDYDRMLKIGFVSPDFGRHPVGYFLKLPFQFHDRSRFRYYCYSDRISDDDVTVFLRETSDEWRVTFYMDDLLLCQRIIADGIDILVDLAGHSAKNRLSLFAMKPAPVQVTWAGYVGTTGLSAIDWLISDHFESPPGAEQFCSERIYRLSGDYVSYSPPAYAPQVSELPAISNGFITFGCFNNLAKINPDVLLLWGVILKKIPSSKLLIKTRELNDTDRKQYFLDSCRAAGIFDDELLLEGGAPHGELLAAYHRVDIALDPFPYSGGLTTLESLWMGVPVVTLAGDRFCSRHSLTHLTNVGLPSLVAHTQEQYVDLCCTLADDFTKLGELRQTLRPKMAASCICDGRMFSEALHEAFRSMWRSWCREAQ